MGCDELRELAPEVALGTIEGEERAEALRHLATCADCRRHVDQLSAVADELLMLAPVQEPPAGFESRVIEAIAPPPRRRRTWRRALHVVGPAVAAAAVTAIAFFAAFHDDRVIAERYRETLAQANGRYFEAGKLRDETGEQAGVVFGYQGTPSWLFVTVDARHRDDVATAELVTRDRRRVALPSFSLGPDGSWGGALPADLYDFRSIRLLGDEPGETLESPIPLASAAG